MTSLATVGSQWINRSSHVVVTVTAATSEHICYKIKPSIKGASGIESRITTALFPQFFSQVQKAPK